MVVNLTGPAVALNIDTLLTPDGLPVDPLTDPYFAEPGHPPHVERTVRHDRGHRRPRPAARLAAGPDRARAPPRSRAPAPTAGSWWPATWCTRARASCTPTRSSPTPQLGCAADPVHLTTLTLDVVLVDPDKRRRQGPVLRGPLRVHPGRRGRHPGRQHLEAARGSGPPSAVRPDPGRCRLHDQRAARPAARAVPRRGPTPWSNPTWSSWRSVRTSASRSPTG